MSLEIIFMVIAVVFLVLVVFAVPLLIQVRKTARNLACTLEILNQSLPGILNNLGEITANVNRATCTVNRQMEDAALALGKLRQALGIGDCLQAGTGRVFSLLRAATAVAKGASVFFEVFRSRR